MKRIVVLGLVAILAAIFSLACVGQNPLTPDPTATPTSTQVPAATATAVAPSTPSQPSQTGGTNSGQPAPSGGNTTSGAGQQVGKCPGDKEVHSGETYQVPAGCNVKGDVVVNGVQQYDNDPTTGLIVSCPNGCTITAPWGANVSPRQVDDLKAEMLASGCGSRCASVKVVVINGNNSVTPTVGAECDFSIESGGSANVPAGCIVSGDVIVNGEVLFDNNQKTGLIVVVTKSSVVEAPWGASVTAQGPNPQATVDKVKKSMETNGCGFAGRGGCSLGVMVITR